MDCRSTKILPDWPWMLLSADSKSSRHGMIDGIIHKKYVGSVGRLCFAPVELFGITTRPTLSAITKVSRFQATCVQGYTYERVP